MQSQLMILKFPNARLYMHDLLSQQRVSGAEAIARSACEFGLIDADSMDNLIAAHAQAGVCRCLPMAKVVLENHLLRNATAARAVDSEAVWAAIEKDARKYENMSTSKDSNQSHACVRFAPALFDLMLQHIGRYA